MKRKIFIALAFFLLSTAFVIGQTDTPQLFHLDKAPKDTLRRADIKKNLELKPDNPGWIISSFDLEVKYTSYVFMENSTTNKITRNMVDIMKYLKGTNNYFFIKKIIATANGVTTTYEGFKVYVID